MCLKDCECFNICLFGYSNEGLKLRIDRKDAKRTKLYKTCRKYEKQKDGLH